MINFTIKSIEYSLEGFDTPLLLNISKTLRQNKIPPNMLKRIKNIEPLQIFYKNFCKEYICCEGCKKIIKTKECLRVGSLGFCSDCKSLYNECKQKIKESVIKTHLEKYGVVGFNNRKQYIETNIERYGVDNPAKSEKIIDKIKQTKLDKYGSENYNNIEKQKETCLEKYGVENVSKSEEIIDKIRQTHLERYGSFASQTHIKNYDEYLDGEFIKSNFIEDGLFDINQACDYFNISKSRITDLRKKFNITEPAKINRLKTQLFIFDNIKTENKILNDRSLGFELDILIPDINLAIEYNGLLFHSQGISEYSMFNAPNFPRKYHLDKTLKCKESGIQLFHIFEGEDLDLWLSMINNKLGLNERIYARKCIVKELKSSDIKDFLDENHIQGYIPSKINLGLYNNNKLVQVMTFSKPRFNKKYNYELIRLCSLKNTNVVGGPSKLLSYFKRVYKPKSIISYANRRFSNGSVYEKLGFKLISKTEPNYFYFKFNSTLLESRNKYQKHKLAKLLDNYNPNLPESQNMFNNNYRRIFDCGNLVYVLSLN